MLLILDQSEKMWILESHPSFNYTLTSQNQTLSSNISEYQKQRILLVLTYTKVAETFLIIFTFSSLIFISILFIVWVFMIIIRMNNKDLWSEDDEYIVRGFEVKICLLTALACKIA